MNRSTVKRLTAILITAGAISPVVFGAPLYASEGKEGTSSCVQANWHGLSKEATQYIKNDTLEIKSDIAGITAIRVMDDPEFPGSDAYLSDPKTLQSLKVSIDMSQASGSTGIRLEDGVNLVLDKDSVLMSSGVNSRECASLA